jgi:hypothetical protein
MRKPKLPIGGRNESRISAMAVEEDQLSSRSIGDAATDVVKHCKQRGRRQPDGAGTPGVFI